MKYYAVAKGKTTGIFTSWPEAEQQVKGVAGARYKSFKTKEAAEAFLLNPEYGTRKPAPRSSRTTGRVPPPLPRSGETVVVYTDGGAIGNPGPGGYGVVFGDGAEYAGGYNRTTNNRMELMAVIVALEALKGEKKPVVLHSDSRYVINGITKGWARGWRKRGWKKSDGSPALNPDLWERLLDLLPGLDIRFQWVKGHAGDPLNEACDRLANSTARKAGLPDDTGYLKRPD